MSADDANFLSDCSPRRAVRIALLALALCGPVTLRAQAPLPEVAATSQIGVADTNLPRANHSPVNRQTSAPPPTKRKAGILAGAGLVALSLLLLAAGLALARTFKQH